jgi:hypothetical protein
VDITKQPSQSIKDPNQASIIRTNIQVHIHLYNKIVFFLRIGLLFLKVTLGTGFQMWNPHLSLEGEGKNNQSKAEIDEKRLRKV